MLELDQVALQSAVGGITQAWFQKKLMASERAFVTRHPHSDFDPSHMQKWMDVCNRRFASCFRHPEPLGLIFVRPIQR